MPTTYTARSFGIVRDDRSSKTPKSRDSTFFRFWSALIALKTSPLDVALVGLLVVPQVQTSIGVGLGVPEPDLRQQAGKLRERWRIRAARLPELLLRDACLGSTVSGHEPRGGVEEDTLGS